jgi:hypothetical protein
MFISPDIQPDGNNVIGLLNEQKKKREICLFVQEIEHT